MNPLCVVARTLSAVAIVSLMVGFGHAAELTATLSQDGRQVEVRRGQSEVLLTQVAREDFRPYLHPIAAPDGKGLLTQYSPGHHKHQTGLYWGCTRVNGRDYFHHPEGDYWRRVSLTVLNPNAKSDSESVQWQTVYDLLDENGDAVLRQSQIWSLRERSGGYFLELQWTGDAVQDVTFGEYDYGGLFLRMPWEKGMPARVTNSARQHDARAEGGRAVWLDLGMQVEGREDMAHVAMFDHPGNRNYPQAWRVDGQFGVGPAITRQGDWSIKAGKSAGLKFGLLVYAGEKSDAEITREWSQFSGQRMAWAQWNLARKEGRDAKFLTPEQAVEEMTVVEGMDVNVFASEPMITQPMAFCWDDRGRMWIAENRDYENRRTGFSASGDSRILILEDTDNDGKADSRKVFAEGIPFPAGMAVGFDGLFLGAPPNLLFLPDRDRDDKADLDAAEVRLTGWGIRDRHETLNSLHWGPDGWLYGCQGFATPSTVGKPAGKGKLYQHGEPFPKDIQFEGETTEINGGVWRYHPTKDRFEVVSHGFSNPWGIDYDENGQLFITACVIPHLWHIIPGGIYHRQGGSHFNPYVYDDIKTIANHRHRSAHGGARVYLSDALPDKYHGRIFMANIHEHAVLTDIIKPKGSGYEGFHGDDFLLANNAQWVGFSMEIGPQGDVYVLDWHDADICGSDVLNKETGRVFRISPRESHARDFEHRDADLATLTDLQLAAMQSSPSSWHARRARVLLQYRASTGSIDSEATVLLRDLFSDGDRENSIRLRALWSLHVTGGIGADGLVGALDDPAEYVRGWAIQLLCEDNVPSPEVLARFAVMAKRDASPVVRLYLAAALQRIGDEPRWPVLEGLVARGEDADDHNLPKMIWFGLEPLVKDNPGKALALAGRSELPLVSRHIARRVADADMFDEVTAAIRLVAQRQSRFADDTFKAKEMLLGLRDSMEGSFDIRQPKGWDAVAKAVSKLDQRSIDIGVQLSQQFGDQRVAGVMLGHVKDRSKTLEQRQRAVRFLAAQRHPGLPGMLAALLDEEDLRIDAIRAAASYDNRGLTETLLKRYGGFDADAKLEVVLSMASRSESGRALTNAIRSGAVPRGDIPAYVARSLQRVVGNGFIEVWGPIESLGADKEALFAKYRQMLPREEILRGDRRHGRELFRKTCQACHKLHGEGGVVGPDITGANRGNLEYLLGNILTPSAEIQDAYRMQMILTDDGRVYSGIPAEENDRQLKLRVANQTEPVTIAKATIESRQVAKVSMMPAGILDEMSDAEVRDLVAYLQSNSPLTE